MQAAQDKVSVPPVRLRLFAQRGHPTELGHALGEPTVLVSEPHPNFVRAFATPQREKGSMHE